MTVIAVGARVADVTFEALYFDGKTAQPRRLTLRMDDASGTLHEDAEDGFGWAYGDLRVLRDLAGPVGGRDGGGGQMILRLKGNATQRLLISDPEAQRVISIRAKNLHKRPPVPGIARLWAWAVAAVASVALIIFVLVPVMANQLAEFLPPAGERALGEATFEQIRQALDTEGTFGLATCEDPDGLAALATMQARLTDGADLATDLTVHVLDADLVNAFALPGGFIVFFDGLIQEAGNAEEVAAVFAHEIGHVAARDPTRIALRSAGSIGVLGLLLGDFAGGAAVLFLSNQMIKADYTQEAEAAADSFAHDMLQDANLPPDAIATFFERLVSDEGGDETGIVQHFLSHPAMGDRIAAARAATQEDAAYVPVLTEDEWAALRAICG